MPNYEDAGKFPSKARTLKSECSASTHRVSEYTGVMKPLPHCSMQTACRVRQAKHLGHGREEARAAAEASQTAGGPTERSVAKQTGLGQDPLGQPRRRVRRLQRLRPQMLAAVTGPGQGADTKLRAHPDHGQPGDPNAACVTDKQKHADNK